MQTERILYSVSLLAAAGIAYWATGLLITGKDYGDGIAFSEYSTITDPLFKNKDVVRIETLEADTELITGSVRSSDQSNWRAPLMVEGYRLMAVYDHIAVLQDKDAKIWTVSVNDDLPGVGRIRAVTEDGGRWVVITDGGVIFTPTAKHGTSRDSSGHQSTPRP